MITPLTYDDVDIPNRVYQPTFIRRRHRYKGPRETLKINQEIGQYYTDLNQSRLKLETLEADLEEWTLNLTDGYYTDTVIVTIDDDPAEYEILGIDTIASRVARLRNRVGALEKDGL